MGKDSTMTTWELRVLLAWVWTLILLRAELTVQGQNKPP